MTKNSELRARIDRLPPLAARALRFVFGPALELPDDTKPWPLIRDMLKQAHLFAPVHMTLFLIAGLPLIQHFPAAAACEPKMVQLARLTALALYVIVGVPVLTWIAAYATRNRFRDAYTRHAARISLVLMTIVFVSLFISGFRSFMGEDKRMRTFAGEVLRCAYDGTPPATR